MIAIDIPMPTRCVTCPCMCHVMNEREDIRARCQAKVVRGDKYVLVDEYAPGRPEDCPIRVGTITQIPKGELMGTKFKATFIDEI